MCFFKYLERKSTSFGCFDVFCLSSQSDGVRREWNERYCVLWPDRVELFRVNKVCLAFVVVVVRSTPPRPTQDFAMVASANALLLRAAPKSAETRRFAFELVSPNAHYLLSVASQALVRR